MATPVEEAPHPVPVLPDGCLAEHSPVLRTCEYAPAEGGGYGFDAMVVTFDD